MSREARHAPFARPYAELKNFAIDNRYNPTFTEELLWDHVCGRASDKNLGVRCRRQHVLCGYIVDFYVPAWRLVIELDGGYHDNRAAYDRRRSQRLFDNGYRVVRFSNQRVLDSVDVVVAKIKTYAL